MHWKCYYKYKQTQIYWDTGFVWLSVIANMYNLLINKISCSHVSYKKKASKLNNEDWDIMCSFNDG